MVCLTRAVANAGGPRGRHSAIGLREISIMGGGSHVITDVLMPDKRFHTRVGPIRESSAWSGVGRLLRQKEVQGHAYKYIYIGPNYITGHQSTSGHNLQLMGPATAGEDKGLAGQTQERPTPSHARLSRIGPLH